MRESIILISIVVILGINSLMTTTTASESNKLDIRHNQVLKRETSINFKKSDFIKIDGDADFHSQAITHNWNSEGRDGTKEFPYLIKNLDFTNATIQSKEPSLTTAVQSYLIGIFNTRVHFIIENCLLTSNSSEKYRPSAIIYLENVRNFRMINCTINNTQGLRGMEFCYCENILIENNVMLENRFAVNLNFCKNTTIRNNLLTDNGDGISVDRCEAVLIRNNSITEGGIGVNLERPSFDIAIENNTIAKNSGSGIHIATAQNKEITITNNTIKSNRYCGVIIGVSEYTHGYIVLPGKVENITIIGNIIQKNRFYGVVLGQTSDSIVVKQNDFVNNVQCCYFNRICPQVHPDNHQIFDNGTNNIISHNYYDEWVFPDENSDNVVDCSYQIGGEGGSFDTLPQVYPNNPSLNTFSRFEFYYPINTATCRKNYDSALIIENNGTLRVNWTTVLHSQGLPLIYNLYYAPFRDAETYQYNKSHPNPWKTIVTNLDASNYLWNTSLLNDTGYYKLRVNISCTNGLTESYDVRVNFGKSTDSKGTFYGELIFIVCPLMLLYYKKKRKSKILT